MAERPNDTTGRRAAPQKATPQKSAAKKATTRKAAAKTAPARRTGAKRPTGRAAATRTARSTRDAPGTGTGREVRVARRDDGVAVVLIGRPDRPQTTLRPGLGRELERTIDELDGDTGVRAIVIAGAAPGSFLAGADIGLLHGIDRADEAEALARDAQRLTGRVAASTTPVVAAIRGACLGAGLELALACRARVAADDEATTLGQPEVQLGLVPGAGATQRLPRLIDLAEALSLIVTGSTVPPGKARKLGLVDEVVHPEIVVDAAAEQARRLADGAPQPERDRGLVDRARSLALGGNPVGRNIVLKQATERVARETHGTMPAPMRAIEVVRTGLDEGVEAGLDAEARAFGELAVTSVSRNLRALFLARQATKDVGTDAEPRPVRKVGVLGGGLMGAGIAEVTSTKAGLPVRLRDIDDDAVRGGLRSVRQVLDIRGADDDEAAAVLGRITATTGTEGFADADVVIEAVIEKLDVKKTVFGQIEPVLRPDAVVATNTSALPLARLAEALDRPERLVGMHYFSPVGKVPLLEVVRGERTEPAAVATAAALGRRQGKTAIVVNDGTGFYTSRILGPYFNEAAHQVAEGVPIERIDDALEAWGYAVGPFRLLDDVGIDVAHEIAGELQGAFGERMRPHELLDRLVADDRKGAKNGRGVYRYAPSGDGFERSDGVDPAVAALSDAREPVDRPPDEIAERCLLRMVDEAVRCLDDGVLRSPGDGDLGAVLGLGFPPQLGGPFRYVDDRGPGEVVERMRALAADHGDRWRPADRLVRMAADGRRFHEEER